MHGNRIVIQCMKEQTMLWEEDLMTQCSRWSTILASAPVPFVQMNGQ